MSDDLWIGAEQHGYAPQFRNTKAIRGVGFSTGFGTSHMMEDILSPPPRKLELEQEEGACEVSYYLHSAGTYGDFIDMRVNSVHCRQTLTRFSQFFLFPMMLFVYLVIRLGRDDTPWLYLSPAEAWLFGACLLLVLIDVCRPIRNPVRFHHNNREVYVFHKKALYRIPWKYCHIALMYAPHHIGQGSFTDAYNLNLWLYPDYCVNGKCGSQPVALNLCMCVGDPESAYDYWEFVRRFMEEGPDSLQHANEQKAWVLKIPHSDWSPKAKIIGWLLSPLFYCLLPFISPSQFATRFNPIRDRWPPEVHQWTGRKVSGY
ncbi:hypothetical protein L2750_11780 [Shewanella submarina]|uniref:DUF6708 domain-containing protein n=1 Tax=Shewanella submarina TaxID=2016376 RepID=A0ABV7GEK3_9GAMM|nr:DUF6708 domain-containing protein [Shewanella submarina]MCL1037831.1 hypothetical protein [Shewanella submarina]